MYLPDIPVHVIQRTNNGNARFFCEDEYRYFLDRLREGLGRFRVALHAYVLMTNHVHLLLTPRRRWYFTAHAAPRAPLCSVRQPNVDAPR